MSGDKPSNAGSSGAFHTTGRKEASLLPLKLTSWSALRAFSRSSATRSSWRTTTLRVLEPFLPACPFSLDAIQLGNFRWSFCTRDCQAVIHPTYNTGTTEITMKSGVELYSNQTNLAQTSKFNHLFLTPSLLMPFLVASQEDAS